MKQTKKYLKIRVVILLLIFSFFMISRITIADDLERAIYYEKINDQIQIFTDFRESINAEIESLEKTLNNPIEYPNDKYILKIKSSEMTAYDLSVESCGKEKTHPQYGITKSGVRVEENTTIAVDPTAIPLFSDVFVKFDNKYSHMDGYKIAHDTGGAIKGNIIDIYMGENERRNVYNFGRRFGEIAVFKEDGKLNLETDIETLYFKLSILDKIIADYLISEL